jgi:hypothetical protein
VYILALKVYILDAPAVLGLRNDQRGGHITFSTAIYGLGLWAPYPARVFSSRAARMASKGQHDDLLFATCLGVWAWENAIRKQDYISYPGEWELEGVPMNAVGKAR